MNTATLTFRFFALLLVLPLLGACESTKNWGSDWDWFSADKNAGKPNQVTVQTSAGCPPVTVPKAAAEQSVGGTAPLDLRALLHIEAVSSKCEIKDGKTRQTVDLKIDATKGPALKLNELKVPFFAAVVGTDGTVLAKKMYETTFTFSGELTAMEELSVVFTLSPTQADTATIYAGLGIDPADVTGQ